MKKFLAAILSVALILSAVSVVSFADGEKQTEILKIDFEDGKGLPDGSQGKSPKWETVDEDGHGKVLKFTTDKRWESPLWNLGEKIKKAMSDNGVTETTVNFSLDAKFEKNGNPTTARALLRGVVNRVTADVKDEGGNKLVPFGVVSASNEWQQLKGSFKVTADDAAKISESGDKYQFMFDNIGGDKENVRCVGYIDNITVSITVPGTGEPETPVTETPVPATPTTAPTPTPVPKKVNGIKLTFNENISFGDTTAQFLRSQKGIVTTADIKDDEVTKKFSIKNNGSEPIEVVFRLQALIKESEEDTGKWAGNPDVNTRVLIGPGETQELTYTCSVDEGKVEINGHEVPVSELFARFDLTAAEGVCKLPKGTSITVLCNEETAKLFLDAWMTNADKSTRELSYEVVKGNTVGSGDVLPVAFISIAVISAAALVIICHKKREEF